MTLKTDCKFQKFDFDAARLMYSPLILMTVVGELSGFPTTGESRETSACRNDHRSAPAGGSDRF